MEIRANYDHFSVLVKNFGWNGLLEHLNNVIPSFNLYSVSQDWLENRKYICKARGARGDLIIYFR